MRQLTFSAKFKSPNNLWAHFAYNTITWKPISISSAAKTTTSKSPGASSNNTITTQSRHGAWCSSPWLTSSWSSMVNSIMKTICSSLKVKYWTMMLLSEICARKTSRKLRSGSHKCRLKSIHMVLCKLNRRMFRLYRLSTTVLMRSCSFRDSHSWKIMLKASRMSKHCILMSIKLPTSKTLIAWSK